MSDEPKLWAAVNAIYEGFLAGDRAAVDSNISEEATVWDSAHEQLLRGRSELDAIRHERPSNGPRPVELRATDPVIDVFGDVGVVRHMLIVRYERASGRADERIRNTSVWRRIDGRWLCVHNHEDLLP